MALETSPTAPAPVRQIALAISQWGGRRGAVWVEGQMTQVSRRPGVGTVFMTMRDSAADISVPVTCARTLFDSLNPPLVEGASVVIHAKPDYYANRGSISLVAREIRLVGLGELLAPLQRRRPLPAGQGACAPPRVVGGGGSVRRRAEEGAAVPAPVHRSDHRSELRGRAGRRGERPT